jgi:hypothetical protein
MTIRRCEIPGCEDKHVAKGLCTRHYGLKQRRGDPLAEIVRRKPRRQPPPETRTCRTCGRTGSASDFRPGLNQCRPCNNAYKKAWKEAHPEKVQAMHERTHDWRVRYELRRRARNNGLDPDVIEAYYNAHDGRCEICGNPPRPGGRDLNMDHDHATGEFRGMLCGNCNAGIGRFKDDPARLEAAILYLKRHATTPEDP